MSRQPSPCVAQRHEALGPRLPELKAAPPVGGARRIGAERHFVEQHSLNTTRLGQRRAPPLLVQPTLRRNANRTPTGRHPKPTTPHEWGGIERTNGTPRRWSATRPGARAPPASGWSPWTWRSTARSLRECRKEACP